MLAEVEIIRVQQRLANEFSSENALNLSAGELWLRHVTLVLRPESLLSVFFSCAVCQHNGQLLSERAERYEMDEPTDSGESNKSSSRAEDNERTRLRTVLSCQRVEAEETASRV